MRSSKTVAAIAAAALALVLWAALANRGWAQGAPRHYMSAATNNSTLVRAGRVIVHSLTATNSTATVYYLKLYDKVTAPTCGTDVPVMTIAVPPNTINQNATPSLGAGLMFFSGLGFCLVALIADADNTSAVTGIAINFGAAGN